MLRRLKRVAARAEAVAERLRRSRRRTWVGEGRLWLEVRRPRGLSDDALARSLSAWGEALPGVRAAEYNPWFERVVLEYDPGQTTPDALVRELERWEDEHGTGREPYAPELPSHPGDTEPMLRAGVEIAADLLALSVAMSRRFGGAKAGAAANQFAAIVRTLDGVPELRRWLDGAIGAERADLAIGLARAAGDAMVLGTTGPALDTLYRGLRIREVMARRQAWAAREGELATRNAERPCDVRALGPTPPPLREGPIEAYSASAVAASLGAFGAAVASTRSLDRSTAVVFGGLPKPAHFGRKCFASALGTTMARAGFVVNRTEALRRLDRIDGLCIDGRLLVPAGGELAEVVPLLEGDRDALRERAQRLFRPEAPFSVQRDARWTLGPLSRLQPRAERARAERERADSVRRLVGRGGRVLALFDDDEVVALVAVRPQVRAGAEALVDAARRLRLKLTVLTDHPNDVEWAAPDAVYAPDDWAVAIEELTDDERGVASIGPECAPFMAAAHFSIGVPRDGCGVPWIADVISPPDLAAAAMVVRAMGRARRIAKHSVYIAEIEAVASLAMSLESFGARTAGKVRAASNLASLIAGAYGVVAAERLAPPVARGRDFTPWHSLEVGAALTRLGSRAEGLSEAEAAARRQPPPRARSEAALFLSTMAEELATPLAPVLAAGAALSGMMGSVVDAAMVGSVLGLNGVLGGWQRRSAEKAMQSLDARDRRPVVVRRPETPGGEVELDPELVVAGDLLELRAGDVVPADARVLEAHALEVDESSITGESLPVAKRVEPSFAAAAADRRSMLYAGTTVAAGWGVALVVATGDDTLAAQALRTVGADPPVTGVAARIERLTELTAPLAGLSGLAVLTAGLARKRAPREIVGSAVSLAVAAIPEGLPLLATLAELAAARRLADRGALVRNPSAIEALGRVDLVCVDKTGTLTEARIALAFVDDGEVGEPLVELSGARLEVLRVALRATPPPEDGEALADTTEQGLVDGARAVGLALEGEAGWPRHSELAFGSDRGYHAVLGRGASLGAGLSPMSIAVKGAPESVLPLCDRELRGGKRQRLNAERRQALQARVDALAARGYRVLAVAERSARTDATLDGARVRRLVLRGFVALADPVRPSARDALDKLSRAGVGALMITGDHPITALAVARQVGLVADEVGDAALSEHDVLLTGPELARLSDDALMDRLRTVRVVARVVPDQKVRIVRALRQSGRVVAMAGDGANDAAAIRLADVGLALGEGATTSARHAADLVITDGRMETIVDAIVEGRALWASVRHAIAVLVGGNLGEIGFAVGGGLLTGRSPLAPRQLLLVNLLTDAWPALTIATRPPPEMTPEALAETGPDAALGVALDRDILWRAVVTGGSALGAWAAARLTGSERRADTVGLLALVGTQLGQTLLLGRGNRAVTAASVGSLVALLAIIQTPGLSRLFGCTPLGPLGLTQAGVATVAGTAVAGAAPKVGRWLKAKGEELELDTLLGEGAFGRWVLESRTLERLMQGRGGDE